MATIILRAAKGSPLTNNEVDANFSNINAEVLSIINTLLPLKADLASPALTGTPTAPTAAVNTNTTQIATTAFVLGQASASLPLVNGSATIGASTRFARADHVHPTDTSRAPLASPALTGTPTAPTAASGTNTTQVATTAFVIGEVAKAVPRTSTTGSAVIPSGTSAQRDGSPVEGMIRYNTDLVQYESYLNGNWAPLGSGQTDAVKTQSNNTNAPYFLTFVQNNNGSGGYESVGTDEGIYFNPGTNLLTILGNVSATDFNSTSDKRLKNNIKELKEGCSTVALLNPVSFEYKENNKLSYGLVAQELEKVLPELVSEREDGFKAVSYIPLISILIKAVKELDARVQELESRV